MKNTVYSYSDYRQFLQDAFAEITSKDPALSLRKISKIAGFNSVSSLGLILNGKRNLTEKYALKICDYLGLNKNETEFFVILTHLNHEIDPVKKVQIQTDLIKTKGFAKIFPLKHQQYVYLSHWAIMTLHQMVGQPFFKNDPKYLSQTFFKGKISTSDIKKYIEILMNLGFVTLTPEGELQAEDSHIITPPELSFNIAVELHRALTDQALKSLFEVKSQDREMVATLLPIHRSQMPEIKKYMDEVRQNFVARFSNESADSIYGLNLYFYPLTQISIKS